MFSPRRESPSSGKSVKPQRIKEKIKKKVDQTRGKREIRGRHLKGGGGFFTMGKLDRKDIKGGEARLKGGS